MSDYDELRILRDMATVGPWRWESTDPQGDGSNNGNAVFALDDELVCEGWGDGLGIPDMQFIAAAYNAMPELLNRVTALEAEVGRLREFALWLTPCGIPGAGDPPTYETIGKVALAALAEKQSDE